MERLKGERILVTGGTGFVGSHLVEALIRKGAHVIVPFRSIDPHSYFFSTKLDRKVILAECDLKDRQRVFDVVTKYEVDSIFHLGAQPIVTTAYENPVETLESNIMGTVHILEAARTCPHIRSVIVASSDKAYGKTEKEYTEDFPLRGDHPYEVSKSSADLIAQMYYKTYHVPAVITRFGNIYGEGDLNLNRIVPGIMDAGIQKTVLHLRSDGTFVRDYIYVKDVASAYIFLLEKGDAVFGEAFNIASGKTYSVLELIKQAEKILRKKINFKIDNSAKNEIPFQSLNIDKIVTLGWKPEYSIQKTFKGILKWYKKSIYMLIS
jgi:CDP-glucose 4,6-dehydratase